jgi:hypothetical protein
MRKIGILTYHSVCNFGANLQALSTVGFLKKHGVDPIVINWVPYEVERQYAGTVPAAQYAMHQQFVSDHLPVTALCRNEEDISREIEKCSIEAVIIGSDAVAQHKTILSRIYFPTRRILTVAPPPPPHLRFPSPFWGSFSGKMDSRIPVVMMSASSQNEQYLGIQGKVRDDMYDAIRTMAYISVRDRWTQKMFRHIARGRIVPPITPDPVFSFTKNAGELIPSRDELSHKFGLAPQYMLLSFVKPGAVDAAWLQAFAKAAKENKYECAMLPMPKGHVFPEIEGLRQLPLPLSPLEWYGLIKYSSGYIGHNMHPMVVAMHNSVPFFIFDYYGVVYLRLFVNAKSSKIFDILEKAGMTHCRTRDVGLFCRPPRPEAVLQSILALGAENAGLRAFGTSIQNEYDSMMAQIMEKITNCL